MGKLGFLRFLPFAILALRDLSESYEHELVTLGVVERRFFSKSKILYLRGGASTLEETHSAARPEISSPMDVDDISCAAKTTEAHDLTAKSDTVLVTVKWKLTTFELSIDLGQPIEILKLQLFSITNVLPLDQFLVGVYTPGQENADLISLGIKNGQTLILLGEAAPQIPTEPADKQAPPETLPDLLGKSFFSLSRTTAAELAERSVRTHRDIFKRPVPPPPPPAPAPSASNLTASGPEPPLGAAPPPAVAEAPALHELPADLQGRAALGSALAMAAASNDDLPADAPLSLPREFWGRRADGAGGGGGAAPEYTEEERARLRAWLNETRAWRIKTRRTEEEEKQRTEEEAEDRAVEVRRRRRRRPRPRHCRRRRRRIGHAHARAHMCIHAPPPSLSFHGSCVNKFSCPPTGEPEAAGRGGGAARAVAQPGVEPVAPQGHQDPPPVTLSLCIT
jgi:hypothetical protein